jgi:FtsP/CotA-like multicopper oxidase with cupredoxin domain
MPLPWVAAGLLSVAAPSLPVPDRDAGECPRLSASGASADLYCVNLIPAPGFGAAGSAELSWVDGPFTVGVAADGTHRWNLRFSVRGLPDSLLRGGRSGFIAWAASPAMMRVMRLGQVHTGEEVELGPVALDRFLLLISAEPDTAARERRGRVVLRGESASNRLRPADNYQFFLGVAGARPVEGAHEHHGMHAEAGDWSGVPMFPGLDMLPAEMALRPAAAPWLPDQTEPAPSARAHEVVRLSTGDTLELVAAPVRRTIAGRDYTMLGFNGQYPGPLIRAERGAEVFVRLVNHLARPTTVHWHGIRLENRFDGVPDLTQPAVQPGQEFLYRVRFPDAGIFWYHPHVREDQQQDLGLYGNIFVVPDAPAANDRPSREEFLILDDLLVGEEGLVPYGREAPTHAAMGRFGNVMLVNGEAGWRASVRPGEVVRFYLTNVANTRTFNLSFGPGIPIKVIGSDQGAYARESWVESVVIAPAERYVVDVRFPAAGRVPLLSRVRAIDHLYGRFFSVSDTLGVIEVRGGRAAAPEFGRLRATAEAGLLDSLVAAHAGREPDRTLELRVQFSGLPFVSEQLMRLDSIYFNPVEWEGTMPGMNWSTTGDQARWTLRDAASGAENLDIHWRFRRGGLVRIRLVGARNTLHGMQHPMHLHGQRFLVLAVNGKRNQNPVWKDTVLVPAGGAIDLLAEMSNPGTWMLHCHIAEHLQSGMMMHLDVEEP